MKITDLKIQNFRAIRNANLENIENTVLIAGPNGCGKSCILDAIRLLKSSYGGYQNFREYEQWFGEFQIKLNDPNQMRKLFFDPSYPVVIMANFGQRLARLKTRWIAGRRSEASPQVWLRLIASARIALGFEAVIAGPAVGIDGQRLCRVGGDEALQALGRGIRDRRQPQPAERASAPLPGLASTAPTTTVLPAAPRQPYGPGAAHQCLVDLDPVL